MTTTRRETAQQLIDRAPPHSVEDEIGVVGSLLFDPSRIDDVAQVLRPDEFYNPAKRAVYRHLLKLNDAGVSPDVPSLAESMRAAGEFDIHGGMATLLEVAESQPSAVNALWFAGKVRERAIEREIRNACLEGASRTDDRSTTASEKLATIDEALLAITERRVGAQVGTVAERIEQTVAAIYERRNSGNAAAILSPWSDLNRRTGGFRDGELYTVAARPRMGKTSIALNLADHVTRRHGKGVLFVSLEMTAEELCEKLLSARTGINSANIRDGRLSEDEMRTITGTMGLFTELPFIIDDTPSRNVFDICSQARRLKRAGKLSMLIVDHLGLIVPENTKEPRHEQVSRITRRLKILARELRVPVVMLAQLNRDVEKDKDHRPKLSSLRESGSIEQDSGVVLFIHREEEYRPDDADERGKAELIVAKVRGGESGTVHLSWRRETQQFETLSRYSDLD